MLYSNFCSVPFSITFLYNLLNGKLLLNYWHLRLVLRSRLSFTTKLCTGLLRNVLRNVLYPQRNGEVQGFEVLSKPGNRMKSGEDGLCICFHL